MKGYKGARQIDYDDERIWRGTFCRSYRSSMWTDKPSSLGFSQVTWQGVIKATADWGPEMEIRGRLSKKSKKSRPTHANQDIVWLSQATEPILTI
jgi:hypothetical protein